VTRPACYVYSRIAKTITALFLGTGLEVAFQMVAPLVWIGYWGVAMYSEWLLLSLLPMLLIRGNAGLYHGVTSDLIRLGKQDRRDAASVVYAALAAGQRLLLLAVAVALVATVAGIRAFARPDTLSTAVLFAIAGLFVLQFALYQRQQSLLALAKADGRAALAVMWQNGFRTAFIVAMLGLAPFAGPAGCLALAVTLQTLVVVATQARFRGLEQGMVRPRCADVRAALPGVFRNGINFSAYPFGQTAIHSVSVWAISLFAGPLAGAAFHNMRSISRCVVLVARAFEHAVRLELAALLAATDREPAQRLLRHSIFLSVLVIGLLGAGVAWVGEPAFALITRDELPFHAEAFYILCVGAAVYALSQVYLTVAFSLNIYGWVTRRYLLLFAAALLVTVPAAGIGIHAVALVSAISEVCVLAIARRDATRQVRGVSERAA